MLINWFLNFKFPVITAQVVVTAVLSGMPTVIMNVKGNKVTTFKEKNIFLHKKLVFWYATIFIQSRRDIFIERYFENLQRQKKNPQALGFIIESPL